MAKATKEEIHQKMVEMFQERDIKITVRGKGKRVPVSTDDLSPRLKKASWIDAKTGKRVKNPHYAKARNRIQYLADKAARIVAKAKSKAKEKPITKSYAMENWDIEKVRDMAYDYSSLERRFAAYREICRRGKFSVEDVVALNNLAKSLRKLQIKL